MNFKLRIENKLQKGQSLFEVVVAIAISALVITGIVSLTTNSIQNSSFSRDSNLASNYIVQTNEWLRQERDGDLNVFITHTATGTWCFKELTWTLPKACGASDYVTGTKFTRQVDFQTVSPNLVQVDVTITWSDSKGIHESLGSTNLSIK